MFVECVEVLQIYYERCYWIVGYDVGFEVGVVLVWQLVVLCIDGQQVVADVVGDLWMGQCQLLVLCMIGILQ